MMAQNDLNSSVSFSAATSQSLSDFLAHAGNLIQKSILDLIPNEHPKSFLYDLLRDYPKRGGKKFRSALVLLSCEWFGGTITDALPSAIAYELFQNFALIHDDIEDDSLMRRGKPTLHRLQGVPLAVNVGDTMFGLVYETLLSNKNHLGLERCFQVMEHFNQVTRHTFEGQALDIGWVRDDIFPNQSDYQDMITRKTGWYSGKGPCQCGALIAGASDEELDCIGRFGEAIGIGFQARDDILNLITTSENLAPSSTQGGYGKERGGDIAEGKRTLITIELFDRLSPEEGQILHRILLNPRSQNNEDEIEWVIQRAEQTGAIDAVIDYCRKYAMTAESCLEALPDHPVRKLMKELIAYLTIERSQ